MANEGIKRVGVSDILVVGTGIRMAYIKVHQGLLEDAKRHAAKKRDSG